MKFSKYHALGNDYLVLDPVDSPKCPEGLDVVKICHRNFGLGSDGILFGPEKSEKADFKLRILNPDASEAEKSGNGLRIFSRYLFDSKRVKENVPFTVDTLGGIVSCVVADGGNKITVEMGKVSFDSEKIPVTGPKREVINEEFEIERAAGIMGYNAVVAEHKASGQKLVVVDSGNKQLITAEDLKSDAAEQKIKTAIGKFKNQSASIEDFKVTKRGTMNAFGKTAPYVKFEAKVSKLPFGDIGGIISVVENSEGEPRVLLAANENSKYSQLISDEFFKQIK